jgi:hypothetical protein
VFGDDVDTQGVHAHLWSVTRSWVLPTIPNPCCQHVFGLGAEGGWP